MSGLVHLAPALIAAPIVLAASAVATRALVGYLTRRRIVDVPNERSSHGTPTPRGGGLAIVAAVAAAWLALGLAMPATPSEWPLVLGLTGLIALVSWIDDRRGVSARVRFVTQIGACSVGALVMSASGPGEGVLPPALDRALAIFMWVGFINLFNFMDGIDGNAGGMACGTTLGLVALTAFSGLAPAIGAFALVIAAATTGFLGFNWHPARVFMGDVGSQSLGFAIGWLLLRAASDGYWAAVLILPLAYFADSFFTYVRKVVRGERFWRPHRDHLYQKAVRAGRSHSSVVLVFLACDTVLVALSLGAAAGHAAAAFSAAVAACTLLLVALARMGGARSLN